MYNVYNSRLNSNTKNFGGLEWVIDGECGRRNYPGTWAECKAIAYYKHGWNADHETAIGLCDNI